MSKFKKWIKEAHPEYLEEGALDYINQNKFLRNAVAGGTSFGNGRCQTN
jgi:hypothetical protein